jgi:R3H domain
MEQQQEHEKKELTRYRRYVEERISRFLKDERHCLPFPPTDRMHRSIVHDVITSTGGVLIVMSFGVENVDRYSVVYKKDHMPSEDEILARKDNQEWNEETAARYAQEVRKNILFEIEASHYLWIPILQRKMREVLEKERLEKPTTVVPTTNYKDKYKHLVGEDAALEAARNTRDDTRQYGFVPSANKRDQRSIEEVQKDIQTKKRLKTQDPQDP